MPRPARTLDQSAPDEWSPRYRGWRVVVVCFFMALFAWGFGFYGHAVYLAELQRAHGWPAGLIATASTVYYVCSATVVAFVGDAMRRFGPRPLVLGGVIAMAGSAALLPFVDRAWQLYLAYLPMAAGWAALSLGAITNLLGLWFRVRRGFAISLALNGASCGGIVVSPLLVALSARYGFATAMLTMVAVMVGVLVPLALLWATAPDDGRKREIARETSPSWSKAKALRSRTFWTVSGPFALALAAQVGFIVHQIAFLTPHLGQVGTGWAVALTTTMAVAGRVGLGTVIDRLDQRRAASASFASQAAALALMTWTQEPAALLVACAVFGFSVGNLITFPALIVQREFDAASFGTVIALSTAVGQFTYAFGPGMLGVVRDFTGGYTAPLLFCIACDVLAAAVILLRPVDKAAG